MAKENICIVTSACLPWKTGTSINPLMKAAELKKKGFEVTLYVPWIEPTDQERVFPGEIMKGKEVQREYSISYLKNLGFIPPEIEFYDGWLLEFYGILPKRNFLIDLPHGSTVILEGPDHLLLPFPLFSLKESRADLFVVGIIHTNYP